MTQNNGTYLEFFLAKKKNNGRYEVFFSKKKNEISLTTKIF